MNEAPAHVPPLVFRGFVINNGSQDVMIFDPDGRLEFPLLDTYPDSLKDAAKGLCEHVSVAHKTLAAENARLTARIKRLEEALEPLIHELDVREAYKQPEKIDDLSRLPIRVLDLRRARAALEDK